jgi:CheY-like chemotaxis protein
MSHEIRTPMNGVLGMAEVLEATLTEPAERQMVGAIRESGETLLTIIDDILDFSKIEAGRLELEAVQFRPRDLARRVESLHTLRAAEKNISLSVMTTRGADVPRLGDQHRILQILHNLVSNAIKFTEQGEVAITIRCQPDRPLVVEVRDTGIGMTEEQSRRIFEDFVQADSSTRRRFGGTGLGMAIVRRLVEAMEGRVELESRPGEGTRVRVALPLEVCAPAAAGAGGGGQAPLPRGLRVLAADDNRTNRLVLEAMLARLGARAEILAGGREAVAAAAEARFDLILLDISMPEMDGLEALEAIRVGERARGEPPTPAVAVTANALTHQVESYMARGFAGHVAKPIRPEALLAAMHGCLAACAGAAAVRS